MRRFPPRSTELLSPTVNCSATTTPVRWSTATNTACVRRSILPTCAILKSPCTAYDKIPQAHWATYHAQYGQEGNTYVVFTQLKSAAEIDQGFAQDKQFMANMGEDGMKKFSELLAGAIEFSQHNLFSFTPSMSYVSDEWIKADPDFWKPKASAAAPKKAAEKPAATQ